MRIAITLLLAAACGGHHATTSAPASPNAAAAARLEIESFEGSGDASLVARVFPAAHTLHFAGMPPLDAAGHDHLLAAFHQGFPDLKIEVLDQVVSGDRVANHFRVRGTQTGVFQGIPATGKAIDVTGTNVMRVDASGRIAEIWGQIDTLGMLQQLGVAPVGPPRDPHPTTYAGAATPPAQAMDVVRAFMQRFNAHDPSAVAKLYGESYDLDFPGGPTGRGVAGIRKATADFIAAFPDLAFTVDDLFASGDIVVWRWTMTGTQRGALGPFAASGKPVTLTGISLLRVHDGVIVEDRVRADMVGLLQQIGVIPKA